MSKGPKTIIIGAGAAGIAAATRLMKNGLENVTILEAKNRIGGRINTVDFSDNVVELGAQWVHGEHGNVVFSLASPHKLLDSSKCFNDFDRHIYVTAKGEILSKEESVETLKRYYDISQNISDEICEAETYGEYFVNHYNKYTIVFPLLFSKPNIRFYKKFEENPFTTRERAEQLLDWMHKFDNSIQSSDTWFDVSAKHITNYWTCEGDLLLNWKHNGYKILFDLLSQKITNSKITLPIMEKIEFNKDVNNIDYTSSDNIIVKTKDGSKYTAPHVICTASIGVLKERHATMFTPCLPKIKQLAIKARVGYGWLCDVFAFLSVDYQPRVLCSWISGKYARQIELLSDSDVSDGLYLLLDMFLSKAYNIPKFDKMLRSSWYTDEYFRGCYTFKSTETDKLNVEIRDLADPIATVDGKPIILFAGEATHEHYYSTVHGAVETGFREADRILNFHRTCGSLKKVIKDFENNMGRTPNASNQATTGTKLAIIGAGIAGLAAAKTLEDVNFKDYLLIEAQNEVGGRINSVLWNKTWIEHGAQFIHGDQSQLAQLCYQHDLLVDIDYRDGQGIFIRNNGREVDKALIEEIDDLIRNTLEDCEDYVDKDVEKGCENIGAVLRNTFNQYLHQKNDSPAIKNIKEEIFDWNLKFLKIDNSCYTLNDLSTKYWGKFKVNAKRLQCLLFNNIKICMCFTVCWWSRIPDV
ncbi:Spermine oxidase [Habropoda laboriosa]|uniref:Spermine oxidase n=1 Tax=Habropoda laboriosa TaxID=597456 RepID=A0A0L7QYE7_9HYME|nr:Spermine oxidase [Habropoda laboriosa]